jgi:hypothetical protein
LVSDNLHDEENIYHVLQNKPCAFNPFIRLNTLRANQALNLNPIDSKFLVFSKLVYDSNIFYSLIKTRSVTN